MSAASLPAYSLAGILHIGLATLLIVGFWTPVAGALLVLVAVADAYQYSELRWCCAIVGTVAAALVLIGPGRWSIDAWLFGWKRVEIRDRSKSDPPM